MDLFGIESNIYLFSPNLNPTKKLDSCSNDFSQSDWRRFLNSTFISRSFTKHDVFARILFLPLLLTTENTTILKNSKACRAICYFCRAAPPGGIGGWWSTRFTGNLSETETITHKVIILAYTYIWFKFMVNVGKYTINTDPMGQSFHVNVGSNEGMESKKY